MPSVPEDLDVFRLPHVYMTKLVHDIENELSCINFSDPSAFSSLLHHLVADFKQFKCHENIEDDVIVRPLLPRLPSNIKTTLHNDLHSDKRLADLVSMVNDGFQLECESVEAERMVFGKQLKAAIANFIVDYIPHMKEEEEVFLPLLLEYLSESELRQLTQRVLELHHLPQPDQQERDAVQAPSLLDLPPELLLRVFSLLSPMDLCHLSQVHPSLHALAFDGSLWQHLHPVRWANGHHQFFSPLTLEAEGEEKELSHDLVLESNITKELMSVEGKVNANLRHLSLPEDDAYLEHEAKVLRGMMEYLLPQVGPHVHTLDLAHGKAVSNEVVFRMLRQCPNLRYLDLSHTGVSDFAFRGLLGRHHNFWRLEYVDLTGCVLVTDIAIQRIAQALGSLQHPLLSPLGCCRGGGGRTAMRVAGGGGGMTREIDGGSKGGGRRKMEEAKEPQLKYLILSGCHLVTDVGLRSLVAGGGLPNLQYLDLSGLCSVTERGLNDLVSACPSLVPELLFYCDNILAGPYAECANGCQNVGSPGLCCRQLI